LFGHLPALAQLVGDGFEAGHRLGGGFHVVVDLGGLLHGLATYREAGVVYLRGDRRGHGVDVGEFSEEIDVVLEFGCFESSGEDIRVILGGIEGILHKGDAIGTCLEHGFPFLGREIDQEWHLEETDDCLQLLFELQELGDEVTVEWPEGEQLGIKSRASLDQLGLRIRKKQNWFEVSGGLFQDEALILDMKSLITLVQQTPTRFIPLGAGQFLALTQELRRRLENLSTFYDDRADRDSKGGLYIHPTAIMALEDFTEGIYRLDADEQWRSHISQIQKAARLHVRPLS